MKMDRGRNPVGATLVVARADSEACRQSNAISVPVAALLVRATTRVAPTGFRLIDFC